MQILCLTLYQRLLGFLPESSPAPKQIPCSVLPNCTELAAKIVKEYSNSPGHWRDLTNPEYSGVGVGVVLDHAFVASESNTIIENTVVNQRIVAMGYSFNHCILTMDKLYE